MGADIVSAGEGNNQVLGDSGRIDYTQGTGTLLRLETTSSNLGGNDQISTGTGADVILAGFGTDTVNSGAGNDIVLGDNGWVDYVITDNNPNDIDQITVVDPAIGGGDTINAGAGNDLVIAGTGNDVVNGSNDNDLIFGDHGQVTGDIDLTLLPLNQSNHPFVFTSIFTQNSEGGGADTIFGDAGDDIIIGGQSEDILRGNDGDDDLIGGHNVAGGHDTGDKIDGGAGNDAIAGDNASILRKGNAISSRFRTLSGGLIYDSNDNPLVTGTARSNPSGASERIINLLDHSDTTSNQLFGNDYIAGGAEADTIFGQLGNDTVQGDGSIDLVVGAFRNSDGTLTVSASSEAATDGDDYIEGNGSNDVIFGNLGQDDIIGGSSNLFGLTLASQRPDGSDLIFGGAGTDITRNNIGDGSPGRDADMIVGDNANIFRLLGANGQYLTFNYDNGTYNSVRLIPRAVELLDYTEGGLDYSASATSDRGAADEIHGESGNDEIYGQVGNDVLFGEGQDDNIIGGAGHDWISGGAGQDGVIGDDGRIYTSRNGTAETLYGIVATTQQFISTPGNVQQATINVTGALKKTVNLTPFNLDPNTTSQNPLFDPQFADDIIYGGLGNDFLHGGAGDDGISGAEAMSQFYDKPSNPGNILAYNPTTGEFAAYDEFNPLTKVNNFFLNFSTTEGDTVTSASYGTVNSDGNDAIFGDLGNDWLVGGTGQDNLYGGWGDDLLNVDDNLETNGGLNNTPDTHPSYEDRAFGGAGRDILIANTGGDRLIDWAGEFNSYVVPFAPFGLGTVSRSLQPQLAEFLYALSQSDGADPTRANDTGADPLRNGEPEGELGLVRQQDSAWGNQTGAPNDPQTSNISGGSRDVLRSSNFNDNQFQALAVDSGSWQVVNGKLQGLANSSQADAVAVYDIGTPLPSYFEVQALINVIKPTSGWKGNSYIIFDYVGKTDFKFAGIDISNNKLVIGHRTASGWLVDKQTPFQAKPNVFYNLLLSVNGLAVSLVVDNTNVFSHIYSPRMIDGHSYGLNWGLIGFGSDQSEGSLDNIAVQVLPPAAKYQNLEDLSDGVANLFTGGSTGTWAVQNGRLTGTLPTNGNLAYNLMTLPNVNSINTNSMLDLSAIVNTSTRAGFIFDRNADSFKFAAIDAPADQVLIGHYTQKSGWVVDRVVSRVINTNTDYTLGVTLRGATVNVTLNSQTVVSHAFNAVTVDGKFGLFTQNGSSGFDNISVKTNDPVAGGENLLAAKAPASVRNTTPLTQADLAPIVAEAKRRWIDSGLLSATAIANLDLVQFQVAELDGLILGRTEGNTILLDSNAAGYGWFIDTTPTRDEEFRRKSDQQSATAKIQGDASGKIDLLTVVSHELGHILGFEHDLIEGSPDLMDETLTAGTRLNPPKKSA
ncbi:parallel beta-helix repeat [Richelia sinica FACHB-800]|uniref:Parallel beta-helix repeat n=1 Tax=Richelia sinica FACHB-800 TaxID=1357546 RepID=A0A975TDM8_9NOST|nr:hypothetical protein [Richelia sinica]QXE26036.1 parallel beta-helix repeat [Richelia sinica FACHB-800]